MKRFISASEFLTNEDVVKCEYPLDYSVYSVFYITAFISDWNFMDTLRKLWEVRDSLTSSPLSGLTTCDFLDYLSLIFEDVHFPD